MRALALWTTCWARSRLLRAARQSRLHSGHPVLGPPEQHGPAHSPCDLAPAILARWPTGRLWHNKAADRRAAPLRPVATVIADGQCGQNARCLGSSMADHR